MAEATKQLSNQLNYQKQDTDLTERFSDEITTTLNDMLNWEIINQDIYNYLCPKKIKALKQLGSTYYTKFISKEIQVD